MLLRPRCRSSACSSSLSEAPFPLNWPSIQAVPRAMDLVHRHVGGAGTLHAVDGNARMQDGRTNARPELPLQRCFIKCAPPLLRNQEFAFHFPCSFFVLPTAAESVTKNLTGLKEEPNIAVESAADIPPARASAAVSETLEYRQPRPAKHSQE